MTLELAAILELAAPASLPLGIISIDGHPAILAITLQHPPVHLEAQIKNGGQITGARAHVAYNFATRYLGQRSVDTEIEIELAIPAFMGLGSDAMLGLSMAQTLAWAHQLPTLDAFEAAQIIGISSVHAGEIAGYAHGGLLLTHTNPSQTQIIRRVEITHSESEAWAFVFYLPIPPEDVSESLETDWLETLVNQAELLPPDLHQISDSLFQAVAGNDITAFGRGLWTLQQAAYQALQQGGNSVELSSDERKILALMQEGGAVAWGRSLSGYCLWGLIQGGDPSRTLRKKISDHVGIFGGRVMATITDNQGAKFIEKQGKLGLENPVRPRPGVS